MSTKAEQKAELIDLLIDNSEVTSFTEDDREDLETLSLAGLQRCVDLAEAALNAAAEEDDEDEDDEPPRRGKMNKAKKGKMAKNSREEEDDEDEDEEIDDEPVDNDRKPAKKLVRNAKGKGKGGKPGQVSILQNKATEDEEQVVNAEEQANLEEFLSSAPPAFREMLTNGAKVWEQQKVDLINAILQNESNQFTKEWLVTQNMEVLKGLAGLARPVRNSRGVSYGGQAAGHPAPLRNSHKEEVLPIPTMNFSSN